ncbi:MAG TPA: FAD-binding oxidoreductase, partial [Candidatus Limnocylindrales bacterium]|nr:FAD-binding oxidoreductase [Candidatus Limnocylindrales bacterium]
RLHAGASSDYRPAPPEEFEEQPVGTDLITDRTLIRRHFPFFAEDTVALLHARRCGWFSGQQLGMYMLERARESGVRLIEGRVEAVSTRGGRVENVRLSAREGSVTIATPRFVNAAGPLLKPVGRLLGLEIPVFSERHAKVSVNDRLGVLPRDAPLMIWTDPVRLPWSDEERAEMEQSDDHRYLLREFPAGVHGRPEGAGESPMVLLIWTYDAEPMEATFPVTFDPAYAEITLRGMSRMIPGLSAYFENLPRAFVDGGYYTKTRENRFLAGPLPVEGAYVIGGLSGYGMMSSNGAADLLADHISGCPLPPYADAFRLDRYEDPAYQSLLANWGDSGQL